MHVNDNKLNQDFVMSGENNNLYAAALADGVSSCSQAVTGAVISCRVLIKLFLLKGDFLMSSESESEIKKSLELISSHVLYELNNKAAHDCINLEEYSCTLAGVLADIKNDKILYYSTGDSVIIAVPKDGSKCIVLTQPDNNSDGVCVTTTENAAMMSQLNILSARNLSSIIIFSDGAWHEIFDRNIMKQEVRELLMKHDYNKLKDFLNGHEIFDDYSFIALDLDAIAKKINS